MPKVSIIVPMYKTEQYLNRCIDSLINQSFEDIEIILVDDGSPDKCGEIADQYAEIDSRIKVVHQNNMWLGEARNSGIKVATGEFIGFVDSDDYVELQMYEEMYNLAINNNLDVVMCGIYNVKPKGDIVDITTLNLNDITIFNKDDIKKYIYPIIIGSHKINSACCKLYKKEIFFDKNIFFRGEIRYGEDYAFCLDLFPHINKFGILNKPLYYYIENENTIMTTNDHEKVNKFIALHNIREQFLEDNNLITDTNLKLSANLLLTMVIKNMREIFSKNNKDKFSDKIKKIKDITNKPEIIACCEHLNLKEINLGKRGKLLYLGLKYRIYILIYLLEVINSGK